MAVARGKEYLLKGVDPFDEKSSIQSLFGTDLKGRVLQEAIWMSTRPEGMYFHVCWIVRVYEPK